MAFLYEMTRLILLVTAPVFLFSLLIALIEQILKRRKDRPHE